MRILLAVALIFGACARGPRAYRPEIPETGRTIHGGWIVVKLVDGAELEGELIAVSPQGLVVLGERRLHRLSKVRVKSAELTWYDRDTLVGQGIVGAVTTPTHGWFLVITAPLWALFILGTELALVLEARVEYPEETLDALRPFARFPQGLPPGVTEESLRAP